jgi:hypothetical protein
VHLPPEGMGRCRPRRHGQQSATLSRHLVTYLARKSREVSRSSSACHAVAFTLLHSPPTSAIVLTGSEMSREREIYSVFRVEGARG